MFKDVIIYSYITLFGMQIVYIESIKKRIKIPK